MTCWFNMDGEVESWRKTHFNRNWMEFEIRLSQAFQKFWERPWGLSFPLGLYCEEYERDYRFVRIKYKDCATCRYLRFGRCSKGLVPDKQNGVWDAEGSEMTRAFHPCPKCGYVHRKGHCPICGTLWCDFSSISTVDKKDDVVPRHPPWKNTLTLNC